MKPRNWRDIRDRLAGMERAELRDRFRQEFAKRQDALLSLLGYGFGRSSRRSGRSKAGNFFFNTQSIDEVLALLRQRFPAQMKEIIRRADKICAHRFDLLGYEDLDYGNPIDWHLDAVHGKHAPRKSFHKVQYLSFAEVGDSKVTWELNRHQHLVTLAKAFRLTGDHRYADEIFRQRRQWQSDNPYPVGINWASSLEVSFRSMSWLWTYQLLQGAPGIPDFRDEWLRSLALHGRHIERYLSTYFSPNTHLLGEGVGLFFLGVMCPELAASERWKKLGWEIVQRAAERQVQPDGFHFEQSTYYHVYALDFFLHSAILATLNDISIPPALEKAMEKMLTALCLLGRAGGPAPRVGDDDGGRLFDPSRNRSEHLLDPLATGAVLFDRGDYKFAASELREETVWLLGAEGTQCWDKLEATRPGMDSAVLASAGFYLLPSPQPSAQLVLRAGPQGTQSGGHSHSDALSVCLQSQGSSLLLDPGTLEYVGNGNERDRFRGTEMHNTLKVDGANQSETATPFSWKQLTQAKADQWVQGKSFDLVVASHDGYHRLASPVTHRRWVISLQNGVYLIRDVVEGQGKHQLDVTWHLGQELQLVKENVFRVKGASHGLALLAAQGHGWAEEVRKEYCSPAYGQKAPMTVLNFSMSATMPQEFAMLLVTLEEAHLTPGSFTRIAGQTTEVPVSAYRYSFESAEYSFFFAQSGKAWRQGAVSSDAGFVCWSKGLLDRVIFSNGSYVTIDGGPELSFRRPVSWGEVLQEAAGQTVFSSDPDAVQKEAIASDTSRHP